MVCLQVESHVFSEIPWISTKETVGSHQNIMPVTPRFVYFLNIKASCIEGRELGIEKGMLKRDLLMVLLPGC